MTKAHITSSRFKITSTYLVVLLSIVIMNKTEINKYGNLDKQFSKSNGTIIITENDADDDQSSQPSRNRRSDPSNNTKKNNYDNYEPQCDTPVWAMCTKRKKKQSDD